MAIIKMIPGRMRLVDENGIATPEFFRVMQAVQERTGGISGVITAVDVSSSPTGDVAALNVQAAIAELASEKATSAALTAHIINGLDAHDASAISNVPAGGIAATTVQAALNELDSDKEAAGAAAAAVAAHVALADPHTQYATEANPILTGTVYLPQPAQTSKAAAATLTIAELLTGIIQYTGAIANLTLPTGTDIEGGVIASLPVDEAFDFSVIVTGAGATTLLTAAGLTLVGSMVVAAGASGRFRVRKTALNTYTVYRIA